MIKKFLFSFVLIFLFFPLSSKAAELYLWPQGLSVSQNETFLVDLRINSSDPINALDTQISWLPEELELMSVSTGDSIFNLWVSDPNKFSLDRARLIAGASTPWQGNGGKVATFLFKALVSHDQVQISIDDDTKLIRHGGDAEVVTVDLLPTNINVSPIGVGEPILGSTRIPNEDQWYAVNIFDITWQVNPNLEYSYLLTMDPTQLPDEVPESLLANIQYEGLADGVYYFVMRYRNLGGEWQNKVMRRAMIDTTKPTFNELRLIDKKDAYGLEKNLFFAGVDNAAGVSHFTLSIDGKQAQTVTSPQVVPKKWWQSQNLVLSVIDKAGNSQTENLVLSAVIPIWVWLIILFIIIIIIGTFFYRLWKIKKQKSS